MPPSETTSREPSEQTVLSVQNLTVRLPENMEREYAVENISFDMRKGEMPVSYTHLTLPTIYSV